LFLLSYVLLELFIAVSPEVKTKEPEEIIESNKKYLTIYSIHENKLLSTIRYSK